MDVSAQKQVARISKGRGPIVAAALHAGHEVRPEVETALALTPEERLREEDPFTDQWTAIGDTEVIGLRSRFELDLNRPREKAVYLDPADAWGLTVWKEALRSPIVQESLAAYDEFYRTMRQLFEELTQAYGLFVVLDLHSYNHRRNGPHAPPSNAAENPDVNVGTGTMDREKWSPVVDRFASDLHAQRWCGRQLDVRENVKFKGGHFPRWIHENFPDSACVIAVEVKKIFMDEWTGELHQDAFDGIGRALHSTIPGLREELRKL